MQKYFLTVLCIGGLLWPVLGQNTYKTLLKQGIVPKKELIKKQDLQLQTLEAYRFEQNYYVLLQFDQLLTVKRRNELSDQNIELLGYLPNTSYILKIPVDTDLNTLGFEFLVPWIPALKLSHGLLSKYLSFDHESKEIILMPFSGISPKKLANDLLIKGFIKPQIQDRTLSLLFPVERMAELLRHPAIMYIEEKEPKPYPEGVQGRSLMKVNVLGNAGLNGAGVVMAIADDGSVNHLDFRGRLIDHTQFNAGDHGDMTAGLAIGAGNIDPMGTGMATGALLHLYDINNHPHLNNAILHYQQDHTVITSTSFSEGCGGNYSISAHAIDDQVFNYEPLLHCFSAGNSSEEACNQYGNMITAEGVRYGNITGGRKAAKSTIAVANLFYNDQLANTSSRGPAADGRIKPDISAHGQGSFTTGKNNTYRLGGGTSAAAPSLAGVTAMLYQAYRNYNNNQDPSSALIKATLLNTAEDLGRPGPDYDFGWGRVNAARALEVLERRTYHSFSIQHQQKVAHPLIIPVGVKQLKVMVYWLDPPASLNAGKALVNDLDIKLTAPSGATRLPWTLSTFPHLDSITKPAYRAIDRHNNMEQISLNNPDPGNYTLEVNGFSVPQGPQKYYLVYSFIKEDIEITYPNGGERFVPSESQVIRWDAFGNAGNFKVEYTIDDGQNWVLIKDKVSGTKRYLDWIVPNVVTGDAKIRISRNHYVAQIAQPFNILKQPQFEILYISESKAKIKWESVVGADAYEVFTIGNRYMISAGQTTDLEYLLDVVAGEENWFSVRALNLELGVEGRRSIAQKYIHQPCETKVHLTLNFDAYPEEISWEIKDENGETMIAGGPFDETPPNSTVSKEICLEFGCYFFVMHDSYGDGLCCNQGNGAFLLQNEQGQILAEGTRFEHNLVTSFCLESVSTPTTNLQLEATEIGHVSCTGGVDGWAKVSASGGSGQYTYQWSTGDMTAQISRLSAGTYFLTLNDDQSQIISSVVIQQPQPLKVIVGTSAVNCSENNTGSANAVVTGGTPPYQYEWNTGATSSFLEGLTSGEYWLTVTDANNCTFLTQVLIQSGYNLNLTIDKVDISCYGMENGIAQANVYGGSGNFEYEWSNGANTAIITSLAAGTYSLRIRDQVLGCSATAHFQIEQPDPLQLDWEVGNQGDVMNSQIDLFVSGGKRPYAFAWSNGTIGQNLSNIGPGTYIVTVIDANECMENANIIIDDPNSIYCQSFGENTQFEWVEQVRLGEYINKSGNNNGYGNFLQIPWSITAGQSYQLELEPGFPAVPFKEYWQVWIDYNQDGDFDDPREEVFATSAKTGTIYTTLNIPSEVMVGSTKMRIAMKYGSAPSSCGAIGYGEVEDYELHISSVESVYHPEGIVLKAFENKQLKQQQNAILIFPNPGYDRVNFQISASVPQKVNMVITNNLGQTILEQVQNLEKGSNRFKFATVNLPSGRYMVLFYNQEQVWHASFLIL